jgi:CopA family copper-resistance protein
MLCEITASGTQMPIFSAQDLLLTRRRFVKGATSAGALFALNSLTASESANKQFNTHQRLQQKQIELSINYQTVNFTGNNTQATTINQSLPGPTLHWREGDEIRIGVTNHLAVDTSIHWHGIILPSEMDGVPGLSFAGIKPGERFEYRFTLKQNGTYWYHAHSGFQEQTGLLGAIIIDPLEPEPFDYERDYIVLLSDWSDSNPHDIYANLKKQSHYYNTDERTFSDLWQDIRNKGIANTWREREMWNQMRMSDRDISDVTGMTYTFLMNGQTPEQAWTGLFKAGEKIRLRIINGAAMTIFDVRIPGLKMTVIAADGQYIQPVTVDDFRIATAETYDVIVEPESDSAYTIFAQTIDRSGYARGTLTSHKELSAIIPAMDPRPILSHRDMGMQHGADHKSLSTKDHHAHTNMQHQNMEHRHHTMMHSNHDMQTNNVIGNGMAGFGSSTNIHSKKIKLGAQIDMLAENPQYQLDDPGIGLRDHWKNYQRKVLTYADLKNLRKTPDSREPSREIILHLTGNMHRYQWSFDGIPFSEAEPLYLSYGERVRITLVNNTMMNHPIHLHGMWSDLETGDGNYIPRKHTLIVQPGSKISYLVTADAMGNWAYHCHMLFHMLGMFREVRVR